MASKVVCHCRISLENGYVELMSVVLDASKDGVKLQMPFEPSKEDVIELIKPNSNEYFCPNHVPLLVRWCRKIEINGKSLFEIGCQRGDTSLEICKTINNWYSN